MEKTKHAVDNKVTRQDILRAAQSMTAVLTMSEAIRLSGKYAKQCLTRLENDGILAPRAQNAVQIRKHILDAFADYERELQQSLLNVNNQE